MKRLWVAVAMAPLLYAAVAHAGPGPTTISGSTTTPVDTATTGDLTISSTGSINLGTAGTPAAPIAAVTIDSSNTVINNGSLGATNGLDNTIGILGKGGNTSGVTNAGTITLSESNGGYADTNKDLITDSNNAIVGQLTAGQNRFGIDIIGPGTFTGSITNSGGVSVVGDNSAGILISTPLTGDLVSSGTVSITGGNYFDLTNTAARDASTSYGIRSTAAAPIVGDVSLSGTVTATGHNAVGVSLEGGVTGQVEVFGTITATGFRSITAPTDTVYENILYGGSATTATSTTQASASELMQGGPAMHISNGVSAGISVDAAVAAVAASGTTAAVAAQSAGDLYSYGSAPALLVDGAGTVGQYKATGYGVVIGGSVSGLGTYALGDDGTSLSGALVPISAQGIVIGGSTTVADGIDITGSVGAQSISISSTLGAANATALHFTGTSSTPKVDLGYGAQLYASSRATNSPSVTALKIDPTASVGTMLNDGTIAATINGYSDSTNGVPNTASGGVSGYATAIQDQHGGITAIENRGVISATFNPAVTGATVTGSAVALDLSAGAVPVTVTQDQITLANSATFAAANATVVTATGTALTAPSPSITGDILFGAGGATLNVQAGAIAGGISFGTGANALNIGTAGSSVVNTTTYPLEVKGALVNTGTLSVNVANGTLFTTNNVYNDAAYTAGTSVVGVVGRTAADPTGIHGAALTGPVNLSSLTVGTAASGATGALIFTANPTTGLNDAFNVSGTATLYSGAAIGVSLTSKITTSETYQVIKAGNLVASNLNDALLGSIPYLYTGTITATTGANGTVDVTLAPKTAAQAGLNPAETSAFNAVFANFDNQAATSAALLGKTTKQDFTRLYDQFLPDYAGGPFETMMIGQQAIARAESEGPLKLRDDESRGWVQEISYVNDRDTTASVNGYNGSGFGAAAGYEQANADGAVGVAAAFMTNAVHNSVQVPDASLSASVIEAGVYWRSTGPGLNASANVNAGLAFFQSHRYVIDQASDTTAATLINSAKSNWNGGLVSAQIELNYPIQMGRFYLRPEVSADYTALYESAHTESDGGSAVDLSIASKTNQEAAVQGDMVMGATFGDSVKWRPEMTIGWREIVAGGPASTTAHFSAGGPSFVLSPQFTERGGLLARLGLRAGGAFADFSADAGGVFRSGYETYDARAMARFLF